MANTFTIDINLSGSADEIITLITDTSLILTVNRIVYNKASLLYRVFLSGTFEDNGIPTPADLIGQTALITLATESVYNDDWEIKGTGETGGDAFFEIAGPNLISSIANGISDIDAIPSMVFLINLDGGGFGAGYGGNEHLGGFSGVIANSDEPQYDGTWLIDNIDNDASTFTIDDPGFGDTSTDAGTWTINNVPVEQELEGTSAIFTVEITRETITIGVS